MSSEIGGLNFDEVKELLVVRDENNVTVVRTTSDNPDFKFNCST
jgi:hypothetical protein